MASAALVTVVCVLLTSSAVAVNIALHKPAYQIGVYGGHGATADKAVDGRYDSDSGYNYLSVCAHPDTSWDGSVPAVWWVDLEDTYSISNVTIYNTYDTEAYQRLNHFTVEVTSDNITLHSCGVYSGPEPVYRGASYTFNCNNRQGRYVYVRKLPGSVRQQEMIILCEVVVDGFLGTKTTTTTTKTTAATKTIAITTSRTSTTTTTNPAPTISISQEDKINTISDSSDKTKPVRITSTLPWVLFALACAVIIILAIFFVYFVRVKKPNHVTQPANQSDNAMPAQTVSSYTNASDDITRDQQNVNTSNMDYVGYEDVDVRNVNQINNQLDNKEQTQQYESLHGQASSVDYTNTPYETIR